MAEQKEILGQEALLAVKDRINAVKSDLENDLGAKEETSNKVTALSNTSTDTQYPSAKAVYDELQLKASKTGPLPYYTASSSDNVADFIVNNGLNHKVICLSVGSGHYIGVFLFDDSAHDGFEFEQVGNVDRYYSSAIDFSDKTFNDIFSSTYKINFEESNNKVTSLSSSSTDIQYPSAKAVKDYVDAADALKLDKDNFGWAIADHTYSEEFTYSVGDTVYYDGYLYICNTAIATPEPFDYHKWDKTTLERLIWYKQDKLTSSTGINIYTAFDQAEGKNKTYVKATGVEYKNNDTIQQEALKFIRLTQSQYDALATKDANTLYIIIG